MRNYPPFPRATPHQKAGFPRVPHPSATRTPERATFDLHALGTPPALILSQDQTLHQVCPNTFYLLRKAPEGLFHCFVRLPTRCCLSQSVATPGHPKVTTCPNCSRQALNSFSIFGRPSRNVPQCPKATPASGSHSRSSGPSDPPTCQGAPTLSSDKKDRLVEADTAALSQHFG